MFKKVLASMIVVGSMSYLTVAGTFAIMSGDTSNAKSSISSGTLTFSNTVNSGTACYSFNGPLNANPSCDALIASSTLMYPGQLVQTKVTIANDGSLTPSALYTYMPSCTQTSSPSAPAYTSGGANPCGTNGLQFYVQETDASWNATKCWYPSGTTMCALNTSSLNGFSLLYPNAGTVLNLGSGPANGASRYFIIGMQLPTNASNSLQGQEALFSLTWGFTQ